MIRLKNEKEIDGIRVSCRKLSQLFEELIPKIRAGMSTKNIDDLCVEYIKKIGGTPAWYEEDFPGAACVSINDEVIHGIPSRKRRIQDGDIVSIDIGINFNGYISDCSKTLIIGQVPERTKKLVQITNECLERAVSACKVGNRIADISRAVYEHATSSGFGVVSDFCGHGVGLHVHEDPSVPNVPGKGSNPRIQAGMVLALEPMINLGTGNVFVAEDDWTVKTQDGKASAHAEHTVAVFKDYTEILTL